MKFTHFLRGLMASAAVTGTSVAADLLQIDFNDRDTETTQTGWEAFSSSSDPNNKTETYSGYDALAGPGNDVSITSAGIEYSRFANVEPDTGTELDDMYRDLIFRNDADEVITITISGLLAGKYVMRTRHHVENAGGGAARPSFDLEVDSDGSGTFSQFIGNITVGGEGTPADSGYIKVTADGTNDVVLRMTATNIPGSGGQDWWGINGLEITDGALDDGDGDNLPDPWELSFPGVTDLTDLTGLKSGPGSGNDSGDFEGDGLSDFDEFWYGADPTLVDSDGDTLLDGDEVAGTNGYVTNPGLADTDGDGLDDFVEPDKADGFATNPLLADTDGDLMTDGYEQDNNAIAPGLDPTDPTDDVTDLDGDGLSNLAEFDPTKGPNSFSPQTRADNPDTDNDGYSDKVEDKWDDWGDSTSTGTDPTNPDSDGDGIKDGDENPDTGTAAGKPYNSDPTKTDTDLDGYTDPAEIAGGSDPNDETSIIDTDGDGFSNNTEIAAGTSPTDINDFPQPGANALWLDFNNTDTPNPQPGYQSYAANNEVETDFVRMSYSAFGTTVGITPSWPDTTDNRVMQMYDRGDATAALWSGEFRPLLRDWIGVDTRAGSGGNGAYDGTTGTPTRFVLTLDNLPADTYAWRSFHHDTEMIHAGFAVEVSTDGGTTYTPVAGTLPDGTFPGTNSMPGGNPPAAILYTGFPNPGSLDPADLPSTIDFTFTANGNNDVLIRFTPYTTTQVHRAFFVLDGFQLTGGATPAVPVRITAAAFDASGNFVIDFLGAAATNYEATKSPDLTSGSFAPLATPLTVTTNGAGVGQAIVPAAEAANAAAFFRMEERP